MDLASAHRLMNTVSKAAEARERSILKTVEKVGNVSGVLQVVGEDNVMLISNAGKVIRLKSAGNTGESSRHAGSEAY